MSNWAGTARTNYVKFKDLEALKAYADKFELRIAVATDSAAPRLTWLPSDGADAEGKHALVAETECGGWPSFSQNEDDEEESFSFSYIASLMEEGQVIVFMEAGAESKRYITGEANAYTQDGRNVSINLSDIYQLAAREFKIPEADISKAKY